MNRRTFVKSGLLFVPTLLLPRKSLGQFASFNDQAFMSQGSSSGHQPDTLTWKALVITNGGATPTEATLNAMDTFVLAVAGIKSQLIWVDLVVPDSLIAAETPLYATSGLTLSTGNGWSGTLNTSGISAGSSIMRTGIDPSTIFSTSDMGLSVYCGGSGNVLLDWGGGNGGSCATLYGTSNPNYHIGSYGGWSMDFTTATINSGDFVYFSGNRTGTSSLTGYIANSNNSWAAHGTSSGGSGSVPSGTGDNALGWHSSGSCAGISSTSIVSFMAVHHGLSSADAQTLYNAVQAFRTTIGGGKT